MAKAFPASHDATSSPTNGTQRDQVDRFPGASYIPLPPAPFPPIGLTDDDEAEAPKGKGAPPA